MYAEGKPPPIRLLRDVPRQRERAMGLSTDERLRLELRVRELQGQLDDLARRLLEISKAVRKASTYSAEPRDS
jgi:hypothetical protein